MPIPNFRHRGPHLVRGNLFVLLVLAGVLAFLLTRFTARSPVIAITADGHQITQADLEGRVRQFQREGATTGRTPAEEDVFRWLTLQTLLGEHRIRRTAARMGLGTFGAEPGFPAEIARNLPADEMLRMTLLRRLGDTARKEAEREITPELLRQATGQVRLRVVLIGCRLGAESPTARRKAEQLLQRVRSSPDTMAEVARQNSDHAPSRSSGGLSPWLPGDRVDPLLLHNALRAGVGTVCPQVVRTSGSGFPGAGYCLVRLDALRPSSGATETQRQRYTRSIVSERTNGYLTGSEEPVAPPAIKDPLLRVLALKQEAEALSSAALRQPLLQGAWTELGRIQPHDSRRGAALAYHRAQLLTDLGRPGDALTEYTASLPLHDTPETRLAMADAYLQLHDRARARESLRHLTPHSAPDALDSDTMKRIALQFRAAGSPAEAEQWTRKARAQAEREATLDP